MVERRPDATQLPSTPKWPAARSSLRATGTSPRLQACYPQTVKLVTPSTMASSNAYPRTPNKGGRASQAPSTSPPSLPPSSHRLSTPSHPNVLSIAARGPHHSYVPIRPSHGSGNRPKARPLRYHDAPPPSQCRSPPSNAPTPTSNHNRRDRHVSAFELPQVSYKVEADVARIGRTLRSMDELQRKHLEQQRLQIESARVEQRRYANQTRGASTSAIRIEDAAALSDRIADSSATDEPGPGRVIEQSFLTCPATNTGRRHDEAGDRRSLRNLRAVKSRSSGESTEAPMQYDRGHRAVQTTRPRQRDAPESSATRHQQRRHQQHFSDTATPEAASREQASADSGHNAIGSRHGPCVSNVSASVRLSEPDRRAHVREAKQDPNVLRTLPNHEGAAPIYELDATHSEVRVVAARVSSDAFVGCVALQPESQLSPSMDHSTWDCLHDSAYEVSERIDSPVSPLAPGEEAIWNASGHRTRVSLLRRSFPTNRGNRRSGKHFRDSGVSAIAQSRMVSGAEQRASLVRAPSRRVRSSCVISQPLSPAGPLAAAAPQASDLSKPGIHAKLVECKRRLSQRHASLRLLSPKAPTRLPMPPERDPGCFRVLCGESSLPPDLDARCSVVPHSQELAGMTARTMNNGSFDRHMRMTASSARPAPMKERFTELDWRRPPPVVAALRAERLSRARIAELNLNGVGPREDTADESGKWAWPWEEPSRKYIPPIFRNSIRVAKGREEKAEETKFAHGDDARSTGHGPLSSAQQSQASSPPNFSRKLSQREYVGTRPRFVDTSY